VPQLDTFAGLAPRMPRLDTFARLAPRMPQLDNYVRLALQRTQQFSAHPDNRRSRIWVSCITF
jgi:hypothetical protein